MNLDKEIKMNYDVRRLDKYCDNGIMKVRRRSPWTGKIHTMELSITLEKFNEWKGGGAMENVMPDLNDSQREFVKNGFTPSDWRDIFKNDF